MSAHLKNTEATIKAMLVNDLNVGGSVDDISSQSMIRDELGVDSLGFEELRVRCEEEFGIDIDDEEFSPDTFGTVESLAGLVDRLQHEGGAQR